MLSLWFLAGEVQQQQRDLHHLTPLAAAAASAAAALQVDLHAVQVATEKQPHLRHLPQPHPWCCHLLRLTVQHAAVLRYSRQQQHPLQPTQAGLQHAAVLRYSRQEPQQHPLQPTKAGLQHAVVLRYRRQQQQHPLQPTQAGLQHAAVLHHLQGSSTAALHLIRQEWSQSLRYCLTLLLLLLRLLLLLL
jgi:RNase adaptor protein for sRNA GlmZ degradation